MKKMSKCGLVGKVGKCEVRKEWGGDVKVKVVFVKRSENDGIIKLFWNLMDEE